MRRTARVVVILVAIGGGWMPAPRVGGTQVAAVGVEVASVVRNTSGRVERTLGMRPGGTLFVTNFPVGPLVQIAHRIQPQQLIGGPDWIRTEHYDIVARADTRLNSVDVFVQTLSNVLTDRFNMKTHRERRELPVLTLVAARPGGQFGPRLKRVTTGCGAPQGDAREAPRCSLLSPPGRVVGAGATIDMLAAAIASQFDRVLVDRTGLTGWFDLELDYAAGLATAEAGGAVPIMTALQEQLGIRVEPGRAEVDVVVIDAIERPAKN